jgi:hypothetical protein
LEDAKELPLGLRVEKKMQRVGMLQTHKTGRVRCEINYAQLEIATGGILTGTVSVAPED